MGRLLIQFPGTTTAKALTETLSKNVIIVDEDLHQLRLHDGSTAGGHLIGGSSGSGVPVGTIIPFAGNSIPQGYLLCDGSAISRTTYASLFAVIGTIYGAGDGNSTFNLPNTSQRCLMWRGSPGTKLDTGWLPNITGHFVAFNSGIDGAFFAEGNPLICQVYSNATQQRKIGFSAESSCTVFSSSNTGNWVLPRSVSVYMCIKYI